MTKDNVTILPFQCQQAACNEINVRLQKRGLEFLQGNLTLLRTMNQRL